MQISVTACVLALYFRILMLVPPSRGSSSSRCKMACYALPRRRTTIRVVWKRNGKVDNVSPTILEDFSSCINKSGNKFSICDHAYKARRAKGNTQAAINTTFYTIQFQDNKSRVCPLRLVSDGHQNAVTDPQEQTHTVHKLSLNFLSHNVFCYCLLIL